MPRTARPTNYEEVIDLDEEDHPKYRRKRLRVPQSESGSDTELSEDDSIVIQEVKRQHVAPPRRAEVMDLSDTDLSEDEEDEEEDDLFIIGPDGKEEKVKSTEDMLKETRENSANTLKEITCAICLDHVTECVAGPCGHFFCAQCMYMALASARVSPSTHGKCPLCRKSYSSKDFVFLQFRYRKREAGEVTK